MTTSFNKTLYNDILKDLIETQQWLKKLGIETKETRFIEIFKLVEIIVQHHNDNKVEALIEEYESIHLWCALTEAITFIEIYQNTKRQKSHILKRGRLKTMLEGPFLPWDEDPSKNNIHGRNSLFELEVAAKLSIPGVKIFGYDDVDFLFNKTKFNVQCKRLHSPKQLQTNIEKAAEQFGIKARKKKNLKGIIALCIDKIIGKEQMILKVKNPEKIRPITSKLATEFISTHHNLWQKLLDVNILGVLIVFHAIAIIEESPNPLLTACREVILDIIPQESTLQFADYHLIKDFGLKIQANP